MSFNILIILSVAAANLTLGSLIYSRNKKLMANKMFLAITIFLSLWMLANFFLQQTNGNVSLANMLNSIAYSFGFLAIYSAYIFSQAYPFEGGILMHKKRFIAANIAALLFAVFSATHFIAGTVTVSAEGTVGFISGSLENVYTITALGLVLLIIIHYINVIRKKRGPERAQAIFIMIALAASITVGVAANLVLPLLQLQIDYVYFSPITSLIVVGFIAYAITRHGLFDVRPFIARSIAYTFSVGAMLALFVVIGLFAARGIFGGDIPLAQTTFFAVISVILALTFQPIKRYFDKVSNSLFFRDSYNPQDVINNINSKLVNTLNLESLLNSTADLIEQELKVTFCDFYLDPSASIEFHLAGSNAKLFGNEGWAQFANYFSKTDQRVITISDNIVPEEIRAVMGTLNIEAAIKMTSSGDEVGFLMVGERKSGNSFTTQDVQLLEIVAGEVAIAVQNALRFEQISQFNVTLQKKIDEATLELQKSNEKLRALDEAKDEFISMASHQLRTPLTSVKGYISMILEGDAGEVTDTQRKFLDQAFVSSQRMVYLIADLLNVSRLKTGKFIIEPKPTYLPDVVESEMNQLQETAASRELKLIFNKPKEFPTLNLDETKIRQVIMNFIDNAIYYTPKGGKITASLSKTKESVEFTVTDTGIGVPKAEQHHLFMKFYRAGNARKARPDGTGLGLFMAKKVVVAQGGAIVFKTSEGKGSTFGFNFPLDKVQINQQTDIDS